LDLGLAILPFSVMNRYRYLLGLLAAAGAISLVACAGGRAPHRGIGDLWQEFSRLAPKRALAVAGDPDSVWVGAAAGGFEVQTDASEAALEECRRKRRERRMQSPCLLYAVGSDIVWPLE
jgi:hypothetical protein